MEWADYLKSVLKTDFITDKFTLSFEGCVIHISPIIKASILMLEDMMANQGPHNIFVFPDIQQFSKEFLLSKVVYNITAGKIQMSYDPNQFKKGQILKYEGCSVEFEKIETDKEGRTRIFIKFSDGSTYGVPIEYAPYFQKGDGKRLSTHNRFFTKFSTRDAMAAFNNPTKSSNLPELLENHKTHLNHSIIYVSEIKKTKEFLTTALIDDRNLTDVLYMSQMNGDGIITNLSSGQLAGTPAIIIASDLYSVQNAVNNGLNPQSIIIDASQPNAIDKQLDAFDSLGQLGFPITCITDTVDSFDLAPLLDREYNLWRWDSKSLTSDLISKEYSTANKRVRNCAKQVVEYRKVDDNLISDAVRLLYSQKADIEDQKSTIIDVYDKLFSLAFTMLRCVVPLDEGEKDSYRQLIDECIRQIENDKKYISVSLYDALLNAARSFLPVFSDQYKNTKYEQICDLVLSDQFKSICIIIPDKLDRRRHEKYWESLDFPCKIKVMYPMEYCENPDFSFDIIVIVGWFNSKTMRKIVYANNASKYLTLIYPCEERWKRSHTKTWKKALDCSNNGTIIKKSFCRSDRQITTRDFEQPDADLIIPETEDEFEDIEIVIRNNRYKRFGSGSKAPDSVEAFPVSFVGGFLSFYGKGHKALVATSIILGTSDKISNVFPEKLVVGDFVIIRESERDIIRELADKILEREGKAELRSLALKWKEALSVEALFSSPQEIFDKLCEFGCQKDIATVRTWITNEDIIQPNDKDDMLCIARATGDVVLQEKLDLIYDAGREVRSAHIQAGRILSDRLKRQIGDLIQSIGITDAFNVWDPISLQIDDIGQIKILKVIDIGDMVSVDRGNTNRLLSE